MHEQIKINSKRNKVVDEIEGEFVSLLLSTDKAPFRTALTILTKLNEFNCLMIADDLRE